MRTFLYQIVSMLFIMCLSVNIYAIDDQNGNIRGKATDRLTGQNIVGAEIVVLLNGKVRAQAITDGEGTYYIENLPPNTYDVECRSPSFITQRVVGLQIKSGTRLAYFKLAYRAPIGDGDKKHKRKEEVELVYTYASLQAKQSAEVKAATSTNETLQDIPATGYLVTSDEIVLRGYNYLLDVLQDIPEFEIQEKSDAYSYSVIGARGVTGNGRILIMQNGVRINSLAGNDVAIGQNLSIRNAKRIEIIVGPGSANHGADAFAAVIDIITYTGAESPGATLSAGYGMYNTSENSLVWGALLKGVSLSGVVSYYRSDEPNYPKYYPESYSWRTQHYETNREMLSLNNDTIVLSDSVQPFNMSRQSAAATVRAVAKSWEAGASLYGIQYSSAVGFSPAYALATADAKRQSLMGNVYLAHHRETKKWSIASSLQWNYWWLPNAVERNAYFDYKKAYRYGSESGFKWRELFTYILNDHHRFVFGTSFSYVYSAVQTSGSETPVDDIDDAKYYIGSDIQDWQGNSLAIKQTHYKEYRVSGGISAQYQGNIGDKLLLTLGSRLDLITPTHPHERKGLGREYYWTFNPRAGVVYKASPSSRFKVFYSEAVFAPAPSKSLQHYGTFNPTYDSLGRVDGLETSFWRLVIADDNNDSRPEKIRSLETSFLYSKGDLVLAANVYHNWQERVLIYDYLVNQTFGFNQTDTLLVPFAERVANKGRAYATGGTARVDYRFIGGDKNDLEVRAQASYTYLTGRVYFDMSDNQLGSYAMPFAANHTIKAGISLRYKVFSMYLRGQYRGKTYTDAPQPPSNSSSQSIMQTLNQPYWAMSLFAMCKVWEGSQKHAAVNVFLRINNLTNARYYNVSSHQIGHIELVPQDPIRITGGVSVSFLR